MCGIAGVVPQKGIGVKSEDIKKLLLDIESRGKDATGIYVGGANPRIIKSTVTASEFIKDERVDRFIAELENPANCGPIFMHTRASTGSCSDDNDNNHPFYVGDYVIVHNGWVSNEFPKELGDTDSIWFAYALNQYAEEDVLRCALGTFALAWANTKKPNEMFLAVDERYERNIYLHQGDDAIWFTQKNTQGYDVLAHNCYYRIVQGDIVEIERFPVNPYLSVDIRSVLSEANYLTEEQKLELVRQLEGYREEEISNEKVRVVNKAAGASHKYGQYSAKGGDDKHGTGFNYLSSNGFDNW